MNNMKKTMIILGAIAAVLLMVSSVTAVPNVNETTFIEKNKNFEKFNVSQDNSFSQKLINILGKKLPTIEINDNIAKIIAIMAALVAFVFGVATWGAFVVFLWTDALIEDFFWQIIYCVLLTITNLQDYISQGIGFIASFFSAIGDGISEFIKNAIETIWDDIVITFTYPFALAILVYIAVFELLITLP